MDKITFIGTLEGITVFGNQLRLDSNEVVMFDDPQRLFDLEMLGKRMIVKCEYLDFFNITAISFELI